MSLAERIQVKSHYTRSVNLERDADSLAFAESYIPTSRALRTLQQFADAYKAGEAPRSWALVGPYGAGKSAFAAFLGQILGSPEDDVTKAALRALGKSDRSLGQRFRRISKDTSGHCVVLITGSPEPLSRKLLEAMAEAARRYWQGRPGPTPKVVSELSRLSAKKHLTTTEVIDAVALLQDKLAASGSAGLLIIVDELGKFLEYEARHFGVNEIYLLQALAEQAVQAHRAPLSVFGLLHQSFDQYAKGLGESLRNEWSKVQGRYENVPFIESTEQTLRVLAAAFTNDLKPDEEERVKRQALSIAAVLEKTDALPTGMTAQDAGAIFAQCYPLHPLTALLLPILCQKVAQNERTLFSYLGSFEPHGLRDSISRLQSTADWVFPWEIYEYFITNQPLGLTDNVTHRRWAEVVTAVERLGDGDSKEARLLKTVGLLNIIGAHGGLKAAQRILELSLDTKKAANEALKELRTRSLIQYRKFNSEYRVWQGSDFDLEEAVSAEREKLGDFSVADHLNNRNPLLPVVARRYSIEKGTLRYFNVVFADRDSLERLPSRADEPRIIVFLSESERHQNWLVSYSTENLGAGDVVVDYGNAPQLRDAVGDMLALEAVGRNAQELNHDPVAQREYKDRYAAATETERQLLTGPLDDPVSSAWVWQGERRTFKKKQQLQALLSEVLEELYPNCPIIWNELINRDRLSSQAAAGRNKLMEAMLLGEEKEDLGIEKFPPEKAIYRALLRQTGIHSQHGGTWRFTEPDSDRSIRSVWDAIDDFFADTETDRRTVAELYTELTQPPYGVREGVIPILFLASYLVNRHELAVYEGRQYIPELTIEHLERLVKAPADFEVQRFRIAGLRASIFEHYEKALFNDSKSRTVIEVVRPLAKFIHSLPDFTKQTKGPEVSASARAVRDAFQFSKSPESLLFEDLPRAMGYSESDIKSGALPDYSARLTEALRELKHALSELIDRQRELVAQAFNIDRHASIEKLKTALSGRYAGLENYTVDVDGTKAFIKRLTRPVDDSDEWFEALLMFLGRKPVAKWTDTDRAEAEVRLSDFSNRILDLETLRLHYDRTARKAGGDFEVILLKSLRKGGEPLDEVVAIDQKRHEKATEIKQRLADSLSEYEDSDLQLAALAEFVDEFLGKRRERSNATGAQLRRAENE